MEKSTLCKIALTFKPIPLGGVYRVFLDALASLVLMIVTHLLTKRLEIDSPIPPKASSLRLRLNRLITLID